MVMDNNVVQVQETASNQEQASEQQAAEAKAAEQAALTEEKVRQMIAEATAKAVVEAKEIGKRELQAAQDRNKAEMAKEQRRAQIAESALGAARTQITDPDIANQLELAALRAKEQGRMTLEQEEAMVRQQQEFHQQFQGNLTQFITGLGVDPKDNRIDWATDAPNYLDAQRRVLESVSKIQKENIQAMQSGMEKRLKDLESKVSQVNVEANSVETTTSAGVVAGSDAEFIKKFGAGDLPMTKANVDRYNKIQSQYE